MTDFAWLENIKRGNKLAPITFDETIKLIDTVKVMREALAKLQFQTAPESNPIQNVLHDIAREALEKCK